MRLIGLLLVGAALSAGVERSPAPMPPPPSPPSPLEVAVAPLGAAGGPSLQLVRRPGAALARVEIAFVTEGLLADGAVQGAELDALGAWWAERARLRALALGPAGVLVSAGCDASACRVGAVGPTAALQFAVDAVTDVLAEADPSPRWWSAWHRVAVDAWRTDWLSASIVHEQAVARAWFPARRNTLGRDGDPRELRAADVSRAASKVLRDGAALVTVVGDVALDALESHLAAAFGRYTGARRADERTPQPPATPQAVLVDDPSAGPVALSLLWASPGATSADQPGWQLVADVLVGGFASRLNLRLREERGLTYAVRGGYFEAAATGWTRIDTHVPASRLTEALVALDEELERMRSEGPSEAELAAARSYAWSGPDAAVGASHEVARALFAAWRHGLPPGHFQARLGTYASVTLDDARRAAAEGLAAPRLLVVTGDSDVTEPAARAAGWTSASSWDACEAVYGGGCP